MMNDSYIGEQGRQGDPLQIKSSWTMTKTVKTGIGSKLGAILLTKLFFNELFCSFA